MAAALLGLLLLLLPSPVARAAAAQSALPALPPQPPGVAWPTGAFPEAAPGPEVDRARMERALAVAFAEETGVPDTRAVLAVHHGRLVLERYAPGFDRESRFQSWSMAKSVTHALVGIAVREGRLALEAPAPVEAWSTPGDPRSAVTLDHLLHMTSGLANEDFRGGEDGNLATSFVARLLFGPGSGDVFGMATDVPLEHEPGTHWSYSTASSMILARLVGEAFGGGREATLAFMRRELFDPVGLRSMVPEFDAAGTFLGGGFVHASARDWARFGLLYLRDGLWDGRRVLPEGWVDHARTPASAPNNGTYGAHWWLNLEPGPEQFPTLSRAPRSTFSANGNEGQFVYVVPTKDLVVVRLGVMQRVDWTDLGELCGEIIAAFPESSDDRSRSLPGMEPGHGP